MLLDAALVFARENPHVNIARVGYDAAVAVPADERAAEQEIPLLNRLQKRADVVEEREDFGVLFKVLRKGFSLFGASDLAAALDKLRVGVLEHELRQADRHLKLLLALLFYFFYFYH